MTRSIEASPREEAIMKEEAAGKETLPEDRARTRKKAINRGTTGVL